MKIRIEATRKEIIYFYCTVALLFAVSFLVGGFMVGHSAGLIGDISLASIPDNSIGSVKIKDLDVQSVDIADNAVVDRLIPDDSITSAKIAPNTITGADIQDNSITAAKITNVDWTDIINEPASASYGGIGYQFPFASYTCTHPTQGNVAATPNDIKIFDRRVDVVYEWFSSTVGGCPGSGTFDEYYCSISWRGADGWVGGGVCSCGTSAAIPCP
jgi:hypothetical protein